MRNNNINYPNFCKSIHKRWNFPKFSVDLFLICGDFNLPYLYWGRDKLLKGKDKTPITSKVVININVKSYLLVDALSFCEFTQINSCKNCNARVLDLILSNHEILTNVIACLFLLIPEDT